MALFDWLKRKDQASLYDFRLEPGPWFKLYLSDWMKAHNVTNTDDAMSGIVTGAETGEYIWVTQTPEWDRKWFNDKGFRFPRRWVPFTMMQFVTGEPGAPAQLPGL